MFRGIKDIKVGGLKCRNVLRCLLIAEELDCRVWDDTSTISSIAFKQSSETLSFPYIFQALNRSIVFDTMRVLNLHNPKAKTIRFS
jgi:hypothetical protein